MDSQTQTLLTYRRLIFRRPYLRTLCAYGFCLKFVVGLFIFYVIASVKVNNARQRADANYTYNNLRIDSQFAADSFATYATAMSKSLPSSLNIWSISSTPALNVDDQFLSGENTDYIFNGTETERDEEFDGNTAILNAETELYDAAVTQSSELIQKKLCSKQKIAYVGRFRIFAYNNRTVEKLLLRHSLRFFHTNQNSSIINHGGWWSPNNQFCISTNDPRKPVAIIIPFRDRPVHLKILLSFLHPVLQKQLIDYRIFVVEQYGNGTFNKGILMNSAFRTVTKFFPRYQCVIFHDVDLIPETDNNTYACGSSTKHMSPAVSKLGYKLSYKELIGGVLAISTKSFVKVNGYSNEYWGWGGEDDDMQKRLKYQWLSIERPDTYTGRYYMLKHDKRTWISHSHTYKLLGLTRKRYLTDGLNSVDYEHLEFTELPFYTHILVKFKKSA